MAHPSRSSEPATTSTKRPLYVELTPDAYEGWMAFADAQGCTMTALVEALGQVLHSEPEPFFDDLAKLDPRFAGIVTAARAITAERRRRKG